MASSLRAWVASSASLGGIGPVLNPLNMVGEVAAEKWVGCEGMEMKWQGSGAARSGANVRLGTSYLETV